MILFVPPSPSHSAFLPSRQPSYKIQFSGIKPWRVPPSVCKIWGGRNLHAHNTYHFVPGAVKPDNGRWGPDMFQPLLIYIGAAVPHKFAALQDIIPINMSVVPTRVSTSVSCLVVARQREAQEHLSLSFSVLGNPWAKIMMGSRKAGKVKGGWGWCNCAPVFITTP